MVPSSSKSQHGSPFCPWRHRRPDTRNSNIMFKRITQRRTPRLLGVPRCVIPTCLVHERVGVMRASTAPKGSCGICFLCCSRFPWQSRIHTGWSWLILTNLVRRPLAPYHPAWALRLRRAMEGDKLTVGHEATHAMTTKSSSMLAVPGDPKVFDTELAL